MPDVETRRALSPERLTPLLALLLPLSMTCSQSREADGTVTHGESVAIEPTGSAVARVAGDSIAFTARDDFLRVEMRLSVSDRAVTGSAVARSDAALELEPSGRVTELRREWTLRAVPDATASPAIRDRGSYEQVADAAPLTEGRRGGRGRVEYTSHSCNATAA